MEIGDLTGEEVWKMGPPEEMSEVEWVASWEDPGMPRGRAMGWTARERIFERYIDSRFANAGTIGNEGMSTLLEQFEEMRLWFLPTHGGEKRLSIDEGTTLINNALAYDLERPMDFFNKPRLYVSTECKNLIFAMQIWTGQDGQKGATKDPIDLLRYYYLLRLGAVNASMTRTRGGGSY